MIRSGRRGLGCTRMAWLALEALARRQIENIAERAQRKIEQLKDETDAQI